MDDCLKERPQKGRHPSSLVVGQQGSSLSEFEDLAEVAVDGENALADRGQRVQEKVRPPILDG